MVSDEMAEGRLATFFAGARKGAGRVFNIVRSMSLNPPVLEASMRLYRTAVLGESPLSRSRREMLAVVVSLQNRCFY